MTSFSGVPAFAARVQISPFNLNVAPYWALSAHGGLIFRIASVTKSINGHAIHLTDRGVHRIPRLVFSQTMRKRH